MRKQGRSVSYKEQFINAPIEAFCAEELKALQDIVDSQNGVDWNLERPGDIMEITWCIANGQYQVSGLNLSRCELKGELDLSAFSKLRKLDISTTKVEYVKLPETIEKIDKDAFRSCFDLKEITIPKSVKAIETHAFYYCDSLEKIIFEGDSPDELDGGIFSKGMENLTIFYHKDTSGWDSLYWKKYQLKCMEDDEEKEDNPTIPDTAETPKDEEKGDNPTIPDATETPKDKEEVPDREKEESIGEKDEDFSEGETSKETGEGTGEKNSIDIDTYNENRGSSDNQKEKVNKSEESVSSSVHVGKTKIVKIKQTKKKVYVTIKKVKNASGYEISYKKGKRGKYKKQVISYKKKKAALSKLKNKKNYYIRVRAFISIGGKKYYSNYSKEKKIKRKKPRGSKK